MTLEAIKQVIDGHFNAGKRALGQLRRAVRDDLPQGAISADRLSKLCVERLNQGIKAFGGQVERLGRERVRFSATDNARALLAVTYGKGLDIAASVEAAIGAVEAAWQSGKDEPRFARATVLRAVYMPEDNGGLPAVKDFDGIRKRAMDFVERCKARNESERNAKQAATDAERARRNAGMEAANKRAVARKAAQAAQGATVQPAQAVESVQAVNA
jgi:hypothetical protein